MQKRWEEKGMKQYLRREAKKRKGESEQRKAKGKTRIISAMTGVTRFA